MKITNYTPIILFLILNLTFPNLVLCKERLAVMNLQAQHGVEKSIADALSVEVRNSIYDLGPYEVLSKEDIDVLAERAAIMQKVDCDTTSQCLIDFGRQIGTKYMVAGTISKMGETYTISLRLLDTEGKTAGVKKRVGKQCKCSEDELINAAREVAKSVMEDKEKKQSFDSDYNGLNASENQSAVLNEKADKALAETDGESWFSKYKWWIAAAVVLVAGGAAAAGGGGGGGEDPPASTTGTYKATW